MILSTSSGFQSPFLIFVLFAAFLLKKEAEFHHVRVHPDPAGPVRPPRPPTPMTWGQESKELPPLTSALVRDLITTVRRRRERRVCLLWSRALWNLRMEPTYVALVSAVGRVECGWREDLHKWGQNVGHCWRLADDKIAIDNAKDAKKLSSPA